MRRPVLETVEGQPTAQSALRAILTLIAALGIGAARARLDRRACGSRPSRLSWRVQSEVREECRPLTAEEEADLPVHMRVPEVCETRAVPYVLEIGSTGPTPASIPFTWRGRARRPPDLHLPRDRAPAGSPRDRRRVRADHGGEAHRFDDEDREGDEDIVTRTRRRTRRMETRRRTSGPGSHWVLRNNRLRTPGSRSGHVRLRTGNARQGRGPLAPVGRDSVPPLAPESRQAMTTKIPRPRTLTGAPTVIRPCPRLRATGA